MAKTASAMKQTSVLLLVDFINDLDFPAGAAVAPRALRAARRTTALRDRLGPRVPVIYANDNFGHWDSDFRKVIDWCRRARSKGRQLVQSILPRPDDYFILKPRHSAFFDTPLDMLLRQLHCRRLILTGVAADICVQFTANDAHVRGYGLWIPPDCVAAETSAIERESVRYFKRVLHASIRPSIQGRR